MKKIIFAVFVTIILFSSCDTNKVTSVVLSERQKTMTMGDIDTLEVTIYPFSAVRDAKITWETNNESVVSISNNGVIQAHTPGEAIVGAVCGEVYAECKITVLAVKADFSFHDAILYFRGDRHKKGTNNLVLRLLDKGVAHDGSGVMTGDGFFLNVDLNQSLQDTFLVAGTFQNDTTGKASTFYPGSNTEKFAPGTYLGQQIGESIGAIFVQKGSLKVDKSADSYNISVDFVGKSGEIISGKYSGVIPTFDISEGKIEERPTSFSTAKVRAQNTVGNLTQIRLMLKSATDSLQLLFNAPNGVANDIPVGDYSVSATDGAFQLKQGSTVESEHVGCWLFGAVNAPIESGNVAVAIDGNKYTLDYQLRYENTRITGRYSGSVDFGQ